MFNLEEYYRLYNNASLQEYECQKEKIAEWASIKAGKNNKDLPLRFLKKQAEFLQKMIQWDSLWT